MTSFETGGGTRQKSTYLGALKSVLNVDCLSIEPVPLTPQSSSLSYPTFPTYNEVRTST